ncbi:hypothetical protein AAG906_009046 [Vitis piasezkii]
MFEHSTTKRSVWVTLKRSSLKSKVQRNKITTAGEAIDYRCLIRATDGKRPFLLGNFSLIAGSSYATILKAHMTALKKREDKKKAAEGVKKPDDPKKIKTSV